MAHEVLYRKWRPLIFEDLVGQEHISKTLLNAIRTSKISHAYIFCGPRGTGKTTTARILAKTLNCENLNDYSPCNKCKSCTEIMSGASLDIIEIDAASNRGISEIRSIIEQVKFSSVSGKYKVYIIDEFHMLTVDASNAILKTLEEPPERVVFILATTEVHKILPTIISRCQKFDFQRIPINSLFNRIKYISEKEEIKISDESLLAIAKKSNGGLRDALSLLDQVSSFSIDSEDDISTELVSQVLGLVSFKHLKIVAQNIYENKPVEIIKEINDLLKAGNDPSVIVTETISFFRNLLVVKNSPSIAQDLEVPESIIKEIQEIINYFSNNEILKIIDLLDDLIDKIKRTTQAQLWLEINFVQLCRFREDKQNNTNNNTNQNIDNTLLNELKNKLAYLENKINELEKNRVSIPNNIIYKDKPKHEENKIVEKITHIDNNSSNNDLNSIWDKVLNIAKIRSAPTYALISNAKINDIDKPNKIVSISFENDAFVELLKKKQDKLEECIQRVLGEKYKVNVQKDSKGIDKRNIDNNNKVQENKIIEQKTEEHVNQKIEESNKEKIEEPVRKENIPEENLFDDSDNYVEEQNTSNNSTNFINQVKDVFDGKIIKIKEK